jgi:hypothetical protein
VNGNPPGDSMIVILDIETSEPIPGNKDIKTLHISLAGTITSGSVQFYTENNIQELFSALDAAKLIVGHNLFAFDYIVLQQYATFNITTRYGEKTFDTFRILEKKTDRRISLNDLAMRNLGISKSGNGINAPQLFKDGKITELKEYLAQDLIITEKLFTYIQQHSSLKYGHLNYKDIVEKTVHITAQER